MRNLFLFLRRHGTFIGFHLDTMPFAGLFDLAFPFGFCFFPSLALNLSLSGKDFQIPFAFFGFSATGKYNGSCSSERDGDDLFYVSSPLLKVCKRVFPSASTTGRPERKEVFYGC